jgi:hypothetical protein
MLCTTALVLCVLAVNALVDQISGVLVDVHTRMLDRAITCALKQLSFRSVVLVALDFPRGVERTMAT